MFKFARKCIKSFVGISMVIALTITSVIPAFAAETTEASSNVQILSGDLQVVDITNNNIETKGSLSGYRSMNIQGSGSASFIVDVNGSWSPWAGCTLKTSGFSSNTTIDVQVCYGNDVKCSKRLGPNSEVKNIAMLNVSPGGYTIKFTVNGNASNNTGNLTVWIY